MAFVLTFATDVNAIAGTIIISEYRVRGPNGANDEFIEIYNNSNSPHTVTAASGTGYGVAASDGTTRCSVPNGTIIPARGHYLCVNSVGYSLASYPSGNGTTATGDATYTTDIPDQAGIAIFNNNSGGGAFSLANRLDAAGPAGEPNTLYREGTGVPTLTAFSIDYAWVRDECGKGGAVNLLTNCTITTPKDTDSNAADFYFVDTNGTSAGGGQRLGSPGPQNLSSPENGTARISGAPLDPCVSIASPPNYVRDFTSSPANNSTFGTSDIRWTFTNNSGVDLTRLRFRVVDMDTFPAASGFADHRPRTSTNVVVTVDRPPCGSGTSNITVFGTTLEQPPSQPNGGGFNTSMSVPAVTLGAPLPNGASIDIRLLLGIQQTGDFRLGIIPEGLPGGGDLLMLGPCTTDGGCSGFITAAQATADLQGDGRSDIFWRNSSTGSDSGWLMNGAAVAASATLPSVADPNFVVVGLGDFQGDGKTDVLWRNSVTGANVLWLMEGTSVAVSALLPTVADPTWTVAGVGDFQGDFRADILWHNTASGSNSVWLMNGGAVAISAALPPVADTNFKIAAIGDFQNDGKDDVLWRNSSTGANVVWLMNGTTIAVSALLPTVADPNWKVAGVGDLQFDGNADIVWRNSATGNNSVWFMSGAALAVTASLTAVPDTNWKIVRIADFQGDRKADILWRHSVSGANAQWLMNGPAIAVSSALPAVPDTNFSVAGPP